MNIGIIDAEIIGKSKHRFPNLCSMKLSAYHKAKGDNVQLLLSYDDIEQYDKVYISKVFIKTEIPGEPNNILKTEQNCAEFYKDNPILNLPNVEYGGTGFFYGDAPDMPYEIEHTKPDYDLYNDWINDCIEHGAKESEFKYYKEYSIGFLTRGCFRKCEFCVNKKYDRCTAASNLLEFIDPTRKKLCFLDDNFLSYPNWQDIIKDVKATGKPFQFKQGLDERLITEDKAIEMATWRYDGDFIFAFDNIADKETIVNKLNILNKHIPHKKKKFYVFCGFDRNNRYDSDFYERDMGELFERVAILRQHKALPYIMRHENYVNSPYQFMYTQMAAWCNQPSMFRSFPLDIFIKCKAMGNKYSKYKRDIEGYIADGNRKNKNWIQFEEFEKTHKELLDKYKLCSSQKTEDINGQNN